MNSASDDIDADSPLLQALARRLPSSVREALPELGNLARQRSGDTPIPSDRLNPSVYDLTQIKIRADLASREREVHRQVQESADLLLELLPRSDDSVLALVKGDHRFHTVPFVTALLRASWDARASEPERSKMLAEAALLALGRIQDDQLSEALLEDLRARAWAQMGNACRIMSDFRGAEAALRHANAHLESGTHDPMGEAVVLHLLGVLRREQRAFPAAISSLQRAQRRYARVHDREGQIQVLITLSVTLREAGLTEAAVQMIARADDAIGSWDHPLKYHILNNQIAYLLDLNRWQEAEERLAAARPLFAHAAEPLDRLRLPWAEGRIALQAGRLDEAERRFVQVREAFIERRIPYDAALVSLELAEVYARQGRHGELRTLAEELVEVFHSLGIEREALASLGLLKDAALGQQATLEVLRDLAARLRSRASQPT